MSLTNALRIGTSGMQVSQLALSTVSQNVVNANTTGYSRQIAQTSASSVNGYGNGVKLDTIQRVSDRFLVARTLTATSDASYATTRRSYLESLEESFTNAGSKGGLESVVGSFINSLNNLSADPSNSSLRRSVVQQAVVTATAIQGTNADLATVAADADNAITAELESINQVLKDIDKLNKQIAELKNGNNGAGANDLLDARANKVAELSKSFNLQVTENTTTGALRITTEDGRKLVDENSYVQLSRGNPSGDYRTIVARSIQVDGTLSTSELPINSAGLTTGRIKALVEIRDTIVPDLRAQLDNFTRAFTSTVNNLASQGTSSPPVTRLTSANTTSLAGITTDLLASPGFSGINGATINISVTNALGNTVATTSAGATPPGTPLVLAPLAPATTLSLQDIANQINASPIGNATLGGTSGVIATATTDANGKPILTITSANPNNKVALSNVSGDALGILGMNNLFTGTDSASIGVRADIAQNADLLPVARMRADGGVSTTDGQNIVALSKLADLKISFAAAGGIGIQNATAVSYLNTISSNLAVNVSAAKDNETFTGNLQNQAQELANSISGVNINEELAQMLVYQNSFQASARIISVVNDLLQELVNIV